MEYVGKCSKIKVGGFIPLKKISLRAVDAVGILLGEG